MGPDKDPEEQANEDGRRDDAGYEPEHPPNIADATRNPTGPFQLLASGRAVLVVPLVAGHLLRMREHDVCPMVFARISRFRIIPR